MDRPLSRGHTARSRNTGGARCLPPRPRARAPSTRLCSDDRHRSARGRRRPPQGVASRRWVCQCEDVAVSPSPSRWEAAYYPDRLAPGGGLPGRDWEAREVCDSEKGVHGVGVSDVYRRHISPRVNPCLGPGVPTPELHRLGDVPLVAQGESAARRGKEDSCLAWLYGPRRAGRRVCFRCLERGRSRDFLSPLGRFWGESRRP